MGHEHAARVDTGDGEVEVLERSRREGEVTVAVGRARHALCWRHVGVAAPCQRLGVAALLHGEAQLQLRLLAVSYLIVDVGSVHTCPVAVAALLYLGARGLVESCLFEIEHVVEHGVEALYKQVRAEVSQIESPVDRAAEAV